jgi:ABC-type multidrug transport system ATPase subunit
MNIPASSHHSTALAHDVPPSNSTGGRGLQPVNDISAIVVHDLAKTYREGWLSRREVHALRGVSFRVERGEIFGLLGPNGAGKTTLIKILLGIVKKTGGQASLLGGPPAFRDTIPAIPR